MKHFKIIILFFAIAFSFLGAGAQDISLNVQTAGVGTVPIGGNVLVEMQINNLDASVDLATYRIRPRLTVPASVTIAASGHILPTGFTIISQTSQIITLSNGTNGLPANSSVSAFINVVGGPAISPAQTVQGNLLFSNGVAPGSVNAAATPGDVGANNSSTTTVEVIGALACTLTGASASATSIACNGGTSTLTVTATGGVAPLEYSIDGTNYQASNIFTVSAGSYTARVREVANTACNFTASVVVVGQPTAITASASAPAALCNGGNTTLTVTASGGTGTLQYSLNGGAFQAGNTFSVNAAGSPYTVTVRDGNLCTTPTNSVTVTQPATAVSASSSVTSPIGIFGGTGTITVTGTGGTGAIGYVITSGTTINTTGATSGVFTGLLAGNYVFTATDANGCAFATTSLALTQPSAVCTLAVSASATAILCNGGTATLTATATGANGPVEYSLNGGAYQVSNTFTVNAAGSPYTVIARESGNISCNATSSSVIVSQPAAVSASASVTTPIAVFGGTGTITVTATGGTGAITYVVTSGPTVNTSGATSGVFTGLASGTYTFTATDANACTAITTPVSLVQPGLLIADPSVGTINFTTLANASQNANTLLFAPSSYKLNIPFFNLNQVNEVPNGTIQVRISLGSKLELDPAFNLATAPLSTFFTWTSAIVADSVVITGNQIASIPADFASTLVFNVRGKLSCTSTISAKINIVNILATLNDESLSNNASTLRYTLPVTITATQVNVTCNGAANGIINAVASPGAVIVIRNAANTVVSNTGLTPGVYTVTATATADANTSGDCSNSITVTIVQPTSVSASLLGGSVVDNICTGGTNGSLTVVGAGGTAPYTYVISGPTVNTTGATTGIFTGLSAGVYTVTVTDNNGCNTAGSVVTVTIQQPLTTAPNISIGSDITGSLFATPGTSQTIVYNIAEINGNASVGDTLRITKLAGYTISFNPALASTVVTGTTYVLDNSRWKIDNSDPAFVSIILTDPSNPANPGTIFCNERFNISVTVTRNTSDISTFPLSARFRRSNGEVDLTNNFNSVIFAAD